MNADLPFCISFLSVTDEDTVKRYYAKFEEKFFQTCEKELSKINTFYSGIFFQLNVSLCIGSGRKTLFWYMM